MMVMMMKSILPTHLPIYSTQHTYLPTQHNHLPYPTHLLNPPTHPIYSSTLPHLPTYPTHLPYLQGIRVHFLPESPIAVHDDRDVSRDAGRLRHQQHIIIIIIIVAAAGTTTTTTTAWFLFPRHFLCPLSRMCCVVVSDVQLRRRRRRQLIFDHRHRYTGVRTSSDGPNTVSAGMVDCSNPSTAAVSRGSSSILLAVLDVAIAVVVGEPDHAVCCESNDHSQGYRQEHDQNEQQQVIAEAVRDLDIDEWW